jgi:hypothetical protein
VPQRSDIVLSSLSASELPVSSSAAVRVAEATWGLTDSQITNVVSAEISKVADPVHQHQRGWIIAANEDVPAPDNSGVVFQKLVMVIDGVTGRYLWAYSTDPRRVT